MKRKGQGRSLPSCACGESRPEEFRACEPRRCKACRRAYNKRRKAELAARQR